MIDTVMALWNREYTGKGVKLFSALLILCISISLLLATESVTGRTPRSNDTYLKNGLNVTEQPATGQANGGGLNPAVLTPTLAPRPYVTAPGGEPQTLTPAATGASNNNPTPPQPSPGADGSPGATPASTPTPTQPPPTPTQVPTPTPTPPPPPPTPTPTPIITPSPTSMGGMTATPAATQTPAAITPAPTSDPPASATSAPAVTAMASATSTLATMAASRNMLLASMTGDLFSSLAENNMQISIGLVTLLTILCQLGIYLLRRRRRQV
jgi:hypothetical protein